MNWRNTLTFTLFFILIFGAWWLDSVMENQAWATFQNGKWVLSGTGWETLKFAWPVVVAGLLIGSVITFFFTSYLYQIAKDLDHQSEIARISALKALSDEKAETATSKANDLLKVDRDALESYKEELINKERKLNQLQDEAVKRIKSAERCANEAIQIAEDAERRRKNAVGAAERRRRKLDKINSQNH